jgi:hypothetical protein
VLPQVAMIYRRFLILFANFMPTTGKATCMNGLLDVSFTLTQNAYKRCRKVRIVYRW